MTQAASNLIGRNERNTRSHQKLKRAALLADDVPWHRGDIVDYVYGAERLEILRSLCDFHPERITSANLETQLPALQDIEAIFSCWGMVPLSAEHLKRLPNLKAIFYAGGSVHGFASSFLERGITICSAASANAIPVAEFCLAQILLSCKGAYRNSQLCRRGPWNQEVMPVGKGVYGETVALLGIGEVSRHLLKLLKPFELRILAVSDYLTPDQARAMGIDELVDIETAFRKAYVVSNHLPDTVSTRGLLGRTHFASLREGATFINTGRGAQVDEEGLVAVLKERLDLTALLDVQYPEPPASGSALFDLPNIHLTSHIAGSVNDEVRRMADSIVSDFGRWLDGVPLKYQVDPLTFASRA